MFRKYNFYVDSIAKENFVKTYAITTTHLKQSI